MVSGCERALFDLRTSLGAATDSRELRVGLMAVELLEYVLAEWRETLLLIQDSPRSTLNVYQLFTPVNDALTAQAVSWLQELY
ncbi:MAG: hypothetical protein WBD55_11525 [Dehalococcoidia bacterium]